MASRRSVSQVGPSTPTDEELAGLLAAVTPVADHKALRPWRLILLRGEDRRRLGEALDAAAGTEREPSEVNPKPYRAELLIAVVASHRPHPGVPGWEQDATAAGAAHLLELALWQAGWGVMWRSGLHADALPCARPTGSATASGCWAGSTWGTWTRPSGPVSRPRRSPPWTRPRSWAACRRAERPAQVSRASIPTAAQRRFSRSCATPAVASSPSSRASMSVHRSKTESSGHTCRVRPP